MPRSRPLGCSLISNSSITFARDQAQTINETSLKVLFAKLPNRCIILLEDIDALSSNRSRIAEIDSRQIANSSTSQESKSASGKVSLSALLSAIDGVGSQECRILIMTTNHITRLDEALIRPGRMDKKVEFGLANNKMTANVFCLIFKPVEGDTAFPKNTPSDVRVAAGSQRKEVERVERPAEEFAARVPELKFSAAEILSFLLERRKSPEEAIDNVEQLISTPIEAKLKPPRISEDAKPEIARNSKLVRL
jgi:chaperone BCS1